MTSIIILWKGKRFGFPPKPPEVDNIELIQEFFGYSKQKSLEALQILSIDDINNIKKSMDTGGR